MIQKLPALNSVISSDLYRYGGLKGPRGLLKGLGVPGFRYTYFFRKASCHPKFSLPGIWYRLILRHYGYKFGFQIPVGTLIGEGFYIGHFGTVVINVNACIGKYCNVAHGVTIGQANRGSRTGVPTIGDRVWIGTGAVIVGKINIGSNVLIAPNSFVNFDVPDNSMVIGNPGQVLSRENPTEGYIEFIPATHS